MNIIYQSTPDRKCGSAQNSDGPNRQVDAGTADIQFG